MRPADMAYLAGFATCWSVIELDSLTPQEILKSLDPVPASNPIPNPWKLGFRAAVRAAFGR